jgi:hypothetical protein
LTEQQVAAQKCENVSQPIPTGSDLAADVKNVKIDIRDIDLENEWIKIVNVISEH